MDGLRFDAFVVVDCHGLCCWIIVLVWCFLPFLLIVRIRCFG